MGKLKKLLRFFLNKKYRQSVLNYRGFYNKMSDEAFLKMRYQTLLGKPLDLKDPKGFNEKLQWLKLNHRKDVFTQMVDKYAVKKYVSERIGEEYIIPTLGIWDSFDEIDFDSLPEQFVLKCTHDSGGLVIVRDKSKLDRGQAKEKIERSMRRNYYYSSREWPYKNVKPRILAEQYMQDGDTKDLRVYKIFNFNGVPKLIQTIQGDKTPEETIDYFDPQWNLLELRQNFPNSKNPLKRPETLKTMLDLARMLTSPSIPFLRTDFYQINGKVYFSEFTFFSDAGFARFYPEKWDEELGSWMDLSIIEAEVQ